MRRFALVLALCSGGTLAFAGVTVSAPANGSQVATTVQYVASATTGCADGISAIGVYSAPGVLAYSTGGSSLNTLLSLSPGTYQTTVEAWDNCGGASTTPVTIYVSGGASEVQVTAPANNATVGTSVQFIATSSSSCSKGVSAMGIYTSPACWRIQPRAQV